MRFLVLILMIFGNGLLSALPAQAITAPAPAAFVASDWTWKGREVRAQFLLPNDSVSLEDDADLPARFTHMTVEQMNRSCVAGQNLTQTKPDYTIVTLIWTCGNARTPITISDPLLTQPHTISINRGVFAQETQFTLTQDIHKAIISQGDMGTLTIDGSLSAHIWLGLKTGWAGTWSNALVILSIFSLYIYRKPNRSGLYAGFILGYALALSIIPTVHIDKLHAIVAVTIICLALLLYSSITSLSRHWSWLYFGAAIVTFALMATSLPVFSALSMAFWAGLILFLVTQGIIYMSTHHINVMSFSLLIGLGAGLSLQNFSQAHKVFSEKLLATNIALFSSGILSLVLLIIIITLGLAWMKHSLNKDEVLINNVIRFGAMSCLGYMLITRI
jgi:hypothetical protein